VTTGSEDSAAARRGHFRAGHTDREQTIDILKTAFVHGQLTKDELDVRAGQALAARTYADLAALTADIPPRPPAARPPRPPAPVRCRPLARAAAASGACLVVAVAAAWVFLLSIAGDGDYHGIRGASPPPETPGALALLVAVIAAGMAFVIVVNAVATAVRQRRSRNQLPPGPRPGGHALEAERRGGTGDGPVPSRPRSDPAKANLRAHDARQRQRHIPAPSAPVGPVGP
jgi:Domain of unknown function (DUF1707)